MIELVQLWHSIAHAVDLQNFDSSDKRSIVRDIASTRPSSEPAQLDFFIIFRICPKINWKRYKSMLDFNHELWLIKWALFIIAKRVHLSGIWLMRAYQSLVRPLGRDV